MYDPKQRIFLILTIIIGSLFLHACTNFLPSPTPPVPPTDTLTPTISPTSTETIEWFPATSTPTALPTQKAIPPTAMVGPEDRIFLLRDDFDQQGSWETFRSETGSVAFGKNELTLAIASPNGVLNSFRLSPVPADYYLEITANPSLCRGEDMYGLLLRAVNPFNYYRLVINCNGFLRFEWVRDGRGIPLVDWLPSKTSILGPPGKNKIGVWAVKKEVRIYINDVYQFSVYGLSLPDGDLGVFARSEGETALTVNYSGLEMFEGSDLPPTPTIIPTIMPSSTPTIRTP